MNKRKMGPQPMLWPHPTGLVGSIVDGQPDFAAVAWAGVVAGNPAAVAIGLQPLRHSLRGIYQNKAFSVNVPSIDLVKETDYCGLVSGKDADKVKDCGFTVFYGDLKNVPMIEQCPINMECEAIHFLDLGSHIMVVGKVIQTHLNDDCLTEGHPDMAKVKPFIFGPGKYYTVGDVFADAFSVGRSLRKKKTK